uniref:SFRICE_000690 n=1 Tax=Spodoptera frugiperda TaxID=7108 RepID=A0A2H1V085_SPOFR
MWISGNILAIRKIERGVVCKVPHSPYCVTLKGNPVTILQFVRKKDGKELAVVNGYTFYCHKSNVKTNTWSCTKGGFCKARLIITNDTRAAHRTVVSAKLEHVHPPPSFIISNGFYVKI